MYLIARPCPALRQAQRMLAALLFLLAGLIPAGAETYPSPANPFVSDLAGVLDGGARDALKSSLEELRTNTGVEMTVLTIPSRHDYGSEGTLESYVTALFNSWGIGKRDRNDGVLLYVAPKDREARIELGAGYDAGFNTVAAGIMKETMLPAIREGDMARALEGGTRRIIDEIVIPNLDGKGPATKSVLDRLMPWLFGLFAAALISKSLADRYLGDWAYFLRRCPQCGRRGLHRDHILQSGGAPAPARPPGTSPAAIAPGVIVDSCRSCGYRHESPWDRHRAASRSGGDGFGGGRSSGGGASGRW